MRSRQPELWYRCSSKSQLVRVEAGWNRRICQAIQLSNHLRTERLEALNIQSAEYIVDHNYPLLVLQIDDLQAILGTDNKRSIRELGYVFLGDEFESLTPTVVIPASPTDNRSEMVLQGFTDDPVVLRLFDDFIAATNIGTFSPGPVAIPGSMR